MVLRVPSNHRSTREQPAQGALQDQLKVYADVLHHGILRVCKALCGVPDGGYKFTDYYAYDVDTQEVEVIRRPVEYDDASEPHTWQFPVAWILLPTVEDIQAQATQAAQDAVQAAYEHLQARAALHASGGPEGDWSLQLSVALARLNGAKATRALLARDIAEIRVAAGSGRAQ